MFKEKPILIRPDGSEIRQYPEGVRCEIARSFSYKLNLVRYGFPYESEEFFCSQKTECLLDDAEAVSEHVYQFCRAQVMKAARERVVELTRRKAG